MENESSNWNGKQRQHKPMKKLAALKTLARAGRIRLRNSLLFVSLGYALMLFALAMLLAACATTSTPPSTTPRNPEPPPSRLPESPPDYLGNAQKAISDWRKTLQELIQKPEN